MEDGDPAFIEELKARLEADGWQGVADLANLRRDRREALLIGRVEGYLQRLIIETGEENPTLTVRDVRAHLHEIPQ